MGQPNQPKRVAAIVTEYRRHSHADVIIGKILEGYNYDGGARPNLQVVSMYVDQRPAGDMSPALAAKYKFTIYKTIAEALRRGGNTLAVDGVLSIGEHGKYGTNALGQILYPRRQFFEQIMNVFAQAGRSVPVFNDKHLATSWTDALWMYNRARELHAPFIAGSSVPVTWRRPALTIAPNTHILDAVQIGYGPFEGYGFHALEGLQCMVENRRGGETGVRWVHCLQGEAMWKALDNGEFSRPTFEAALSRVPAHAQGNIRTVTANAKDAGIFLIQYRDGLRAAVVVPNGWIYEGDGGGFTFAARVAGQPQPVSTQFYLQQPDPFAHFAYQLRAIDATIQTYHPAYPVERTLLTTGILEAVMISKHEKHRRVMTPHLDVRYQPTGWPFATDPVPKTIKR
jgi:hypothetical protein